MNTRQVAGVLTVGMVLAVAVAPAYALTIGQVDQQQTSGDGGVNFNVVVEPGGQEFTPTLNALDVVELYLANTASYSLDPDQVRTVIRQGTITGTVLGTSDTVTLPAGFDGTALFGFSSPVSLTPGQLYVIKIDRVGGDNFAVRRLSTDGYAGGRAIFAGIPSGGSDLYFREGLQIPEPATMGLLGLGGLGLIAWRKRRIVEQR